MSLFHQHEWSEVARTYAPPRVEDVDISGGGDGVRLLIERMKFGVTNILWRCIRCDKFRKDELLGKVV